MESHNSMVSNLPDDLVIGILSMLPVTTLMRFRVVCKSWDALTRDPVFITSHTKIVSSSSATEDNTMIVKCNSKASTRVSLICKTTLNDTFALKAPFFCQDLLSLQISRPCEGIVFLYGVYRNNFYFSGVPGSKKIKRTNGVGRDSLALWNPATREIKELPLSDFVPPNDFRHNEPPNVTRFGYDPATNDYKVVRIIKGFVERNRHESKGPGSLYCKRIGMHLHTFGSSPFCIATRVEVFSLNKNSWKSVERMQVNAWDLFYCRYYYVYLNGFCYWTSTDPQKQGIGVISFDMTNDVFSEIVVPPEIYDHVRIFNKYDHDLFVLNGSLCIGSRHPGNVLRIWAMVEEKERNGSNTKRRWIKQSEVAMSTFYNVKLTRKNGDMIMQHFDGRFKLCDSSTRHFKTLNSILTSRSKAERTVFCRETLVSLKTT